MIDEVVRPGLLNPRDTCYVNAFMQILFQCLPRKVLIVAWPNRDRIISALHLMFVAMSHNRFIDAVSLSAVCEPDAFDGKDCFDLGLHILGALRGASLGTFRDTIQQLFCFRSLDFRPLSPLDVFPIDIHSSDTFPFPDPLLGPNV
jgi:hypothetical protein